MKSFGTFSFENSFFFAYFIQDWFEVVLISIFDTPFIPTCKQEEEKITTLKAPCSHFDKRIHFCYLALNLEGQCDHDIWGSVVQLHSCISIQKVQYTIYMNKIKELIQQITKKGVIISGIIVLGLIIVGTTVWPYQFFKKEITAEQADINTEESVEKATEQLFTKEDVIRGEYKNDVQSAGVYVNNTQEVQIAVVADETTKKIIGDTKDISCGHITFATTRVTGPAVLTNSLKALFEDKVAVDFTPGNIIPTYHPELSLKNVVIDDGVAKIYLEGNFTGEHDGWCDASLAIAQITETALTFPSVRTVEVYQGEEKIY